MPGNREDAKDSVLPKGTSSAVPHCKASDPALAAELRFSNFGVIESTSTYSPGLHTEVQVVS